MSESDDARCQQKRSASERSGGNEGDWENPAV